MCEFRIHIVLPTGIFDLNSLHFMAIRIAISLTMHCHNRTDGNGVLLQAGRSGAERGASVISQTWPSEVMIFMVRCGPASLTPSVTVPVMAVTPSTFPPSRDVRRRE